jgi:hypothetical protein
MMKPDVETRITRLVLNRHGVKDAGGRQSNQAVRNPTTTRMALA